MAITYEHVCNDCGFEWLMEHALEELEENRHLPCPDCDGEDTFIAVTTSAAIHFKGPGWSPQGYSKTVPLENLAKQIPVTTFNSKEDHDRVMKAEAREAELKRLKKENEAAKKALGPDAAVTQKEADRRISKAERKALDV